MIVFDASVIIAHLDASDALSARATRLLESVSAEPWAWSVLTQAETLVRAERLGRLAEALSALDQLQLACIPLDAVDGVALARLRAETGLRMPDCCVLHAAEKNAAAIATFDDRMSAAATRRGTRVIAG